MDYHNIHLLSESEQMYLVRIAMLVEDGMSPPIPLAALADALAIQQVSTNQMVRKLNDVGLVIYLPYKGVTLTSSGQSVAIRILRYRRLWEVFLFDRLGMSAEEADSLACRLEHLTVDDVANRLSRFLGNPQVSPRNKPIPPPDTLPELVAWVSLDQAPITSELQIVRVETDAVTCAFLASDGICPGSIVSVLVVGSDGSLLLDNAGHRLRLRRTIAAMILVQPLAVTAPLPVHVEG